MNKENIQKLVLASGVALALASTQASAVSFSGDIELNTDAIDSTGDMQFSQGGRVAVNATGKKTMGSKYIEGKGTVLAGKDGGASVDDMWVKFGSDSWSLQAGRFEGINLFPLGKDTLVVHAGDGSAQTYFANMGRGRAGDNAGQFALVVKPSGGLSLELDTIWGSTDGDDQDPLSVLRPSITWSSDAFSISAGMETASYTSSGGGDVDKTGFGITGNFGLAGGSVNVSLASMDDDATDTSVQTMGANLTVGDFGIGFVQSTTDLATGDDPELSTVYAAYSMPLMSIDGATLTLAASSSSADNAGANDSATGVRARINYAF